jgi:hypothetical protein
MARMTQREISVNVLHAVAYGMLERITDKDIGRCMRAAPSLGWELDESGGALWATWSPTQVGFTGTLQECCRDILEHKSTPLSRKYHRRAKNLQYKYLYT